MTICPVRPLSRVKFSVSPPCNLRTLHVSCYWSGSGLILFLLGQRLSHCFRSCDFCGIIRIICQRMQMVFCGGNGVPKYLNYNYWYPNQDENSYSWLIGGHLGRNHTLARLSHRFYWSGMAHDVGDWLRNCTTCMKRKSPAGRHHPLGNIPTGHRWDRIAMDILDYFSKGTEAFSN